MIFRRKTIRPGLETERIEMFSDGVFAIAITLLILEIGVPELTHTQLMHGELWKSLLELWPKMLSFVISFMIIGIFWVGHTIMFHFIKRADRALMWLNIFLLLFVSFIPFPAALIGEYAPDRAAVILYGFVLFMLGATFAATWWYASHNYRLIDKSVDNVFIKKATYIIWLAPITYLIAIGLTFINPLISVAIYIAIPVIYIIPSPIDDLVDYAFKDEERLKNI